MEQRRAEKFEADVQQVILGGGRTLYIAPNEAYAKRVMAEATRRLAK